MNSKGAGARGPRGIPGPPGAVGKQGPTGARGRIGPRGSTGATGKTGSESPSTREELARLDQHIETIYKEIDITVGRMSQIQFQLDELRKRVQELMRIQPESS